MSIEVLGALVSVVRVAELASTLDSGGVGCADVSGTFNPADGAVGLL